MSPHAHGLIAEAVVLGQAAPSVDQSSFHTQEPYSLRMRDRARKGASEQGLAIEFENPAGTSAHQGIENGRRPQA